MRRKRGEERRMEERMKERRRGAAGSDAGEALVRRRARG